MARNSWRFNHSVFAGYQLDSVGVALHFMNYAKLLYFYIAFFKLIDASSHFHCFIFSLIRNVPQIFIL